MSMPEKNYYIGELTDSTPVYLRGTTNKYYVAVINGIEGVVNWDGRYARQAQLKLNALVRRTAAK